MTAVEILPGMARALSEAAPELAKAFGAEFVRIMESRERNLLAAQEGTESEQLLARIGRVLPHWLKETALDAKPPQSAHLALTELSKRFLIATKREEESE